MIGDFPGDSKRESPEPAALSFAGGGELRNMARFAIRARFDDDGPPREFRGGFPKRHPAPAGLTSTAATSPERAPVRQGFNVNIAVPRQGL
jgi:hypothetical protein